MRNKFIVFTILSLLLTGGVAYFWPPVLWIFVLLGPILFIGWYDLLQSGNAIKRNYPVLGRGRHLMEELRPKIYQYFIESDTNGKPVSRIFRSVVYQRSDKSLDTTPFGTQMDLYEEGYEWMHHSIRAKDPHTLDQHPRVKVGGPACAVPYRASILNISAMSFGSLSWAAVEALNGGAKIGEFAHNTGEGGISPYHAEPGGDLIYQVGTGYFGCRTKDGRFSPEIFRDVAAADNVKMIELKLSQGAKPGHGGILPARKNSPEIARIRKVEPGISVISPPYHSAFETPTEMLHLLQKMRELSGGKPVGFKLCIGHRYEFFALCKAMHQTQILPDFIAVDGGEGGTGAAPLEFSNSVGMPFKEGVAFAYDALNGFDLKQHIKIIAAGKIFTGFHIFRALALGADLCYSARAMMMALGCIQALECNKNSCPTGVATQNPELVKGLVVKDKKQKVANFHRETLESFVELMAAAGLEDPYEINRAHINRRVSMTMSKRYDQIFPYVEKGSLLDPRYYPPEWKDDLKSSSADSFERLLV